MKIVVLSDAKDVKQRLQESRDAGNITFIYHHADPTHSLLVEKFLYINDEAELTEKTNLLNADTTISEQLRR